MKFLVIRFSSIGDIVLTTPVVRCLKQQVPGAVIHFLTKENFGTLLADNPYIDGIHFLQEDFGKMMKALRAEKFDAVIDLHRNIRTLRVKKALGLPGHSFRKLNLEKWLITSLKWNRLPDVHIVDRYLDTLTDYGVTNDGQGLDYFLPPATRLPHEQLPEHFLSGYVAQVTGAAHATKRIPVEKMREICGRLDCPVVLLGGPGDKEAAEAVAALDRARIFNACGITSLHESASLVKGAQVVISSDTGLMHIAAAMKRPLIVLWGNTIPGFGMYPYYGSEKIPYRNMEVAGLGCRPCSKIGYERCPKKHFRCMQEQSPDQVAALVREYWSANP
jgi:ADP-heptose:LPS heptosyltransferase